MEVPCMPLAVPQHYLQALDTYGVTLKRDQLNYEISSHAQYAQLWTMCRLCWCMQTSST